MQSHQSSFGSDSLKPRGHRRSDALGKAMPITSLLLNYTPSSLQNFENIRSDAGGRERHDGGTVSPTQRERPPLFFPIHDSSPSREHTKTPAGLDTDDDLDMLDQDYEILISECSSSVCESDQGDGDRRKSNSEEYISLIGNSKFYTPCLTCVGSAPSDLAARPTAINEMCRRLCTEECRLRLSLAGLVPPSFATNKNQEMLEKYVQSTLETPPKLPPRPKKSTEILDEKVLPPPPKVPRRPPATIAIQRKQFLTDLLVQNSNYHELFSSDEDDEGNGNAELRPPKELLEIVSSIVVPTATPTVTSLPTILAGATVSQQEERHDVASSATIVDPHELAMLKDFREKFEIAEALAKTSAMTSTTQIKQRLAARKREIELENANAISSADDDEHEHEHASSFIGGIKTGLSLQQQQGVPVASADAVTTAPTTVASLSQRHPDTKSAVFADYQDDYEPPRDLLLYLVRMGSFNSAPKINNVDSQDDGLDIPKGLSTAELLQHVKNLRGENQPPLLSRYFLKPLSALISSDITDGLRCLKLNSVSRVCSAPVSDPNHIRLLQWNLLSQTLGQNNDGFVRCPEEALTWENRKFLIVQEILQNNPDIVCLQEVDHFKFLQNILGTQNYEGIFFPKPDSPCLYIEENNGPDGCAIFFKRDKFELRNFDTRILEVWRVQSNQVAIAVNLAVKQTGREICVCTTHLKARHGSLLSKLRNEQGRDLIRFVKQFSGERALLLCGDFNAEPIEPVYSTILNCEFLKLASAYSDIRAESDECNNESTKEAANGCDKVQKSIQNEPPYTTWKIREDGEECHTIDYVFYTKEQLKVKNCLEFPQGDEIGLNRTPSFQYPSDHFSLICDFEIVEPPNDPQPEKSKTQ